MKSKVIILVLTLVPFVLIGIPTTVASWVKFNTFDLVQNSRDIASSAWEYMTDCG